MSIKLKFSQRVAHTHKETHQDTSVHIHGPTNERMYAQTDIGYFSHPLQQKISMIDNRKNLQQKISHTSLSALSHLSTSEVVD